MRLTEVELEHSNLAARLVQHDVELDLRVLDDRGQVGVIEDEAREPQPRSADQAEQLPIMLRLRDLNALQGERRSGDLMVRWNAHFQISDHGGEFAASESFIAHFHFARGGKLIRMASMLPPVLRPNKVPRS